MACMTTMSEVEMADPNQKLILVVDDDELLREFYTRVLKSQGYRALLAINGEEAVNLLKENGDNISLAIIDLLMPEMTGWELIEWMKKTDKVSTIPIVTITGLATSFDDFEKVKEVSDAVLHKGDFELKVFNDTIKRLLTQKAN